MATTQVVKVRVQELSKYGFKANDKYVNYSKQISEEDKAKVVPGAEFEAEIYVADSGKEYLNKVLKLLPLSPGIAPYAAAVQAPISEMPYGVAGTKVDTERAKKFTPKYQKKDAVDNTMSKEEWAAKDQRISRQGAIQAAMIALAPVVTLTLLPGEAIKLAKQMLEFVKGE